MTDKLIITNAFSLSMLPEAGGKVSVDVIEQADILDYLRTAETDGFSVESAVGHASTAAIFSDLLSYPVAVNRVSISLNWNTLLLVGQYTGPRLPEGATSLPEGASIRWFLVYLI